MKPTFKYYLDSKFLDHPEPIFQDEIGSDVSGETLLKRGIALPLFPAYTTWRRMVIAMERCGRCFSMVAGERDLRAHAHAAHSGSAPYFPEEVAS